MEQKLTTTSVPAKRPAEQPSPASASKERSIEPSPITPHPQTKTPNEELLSILKGAKEPLTLKTIKKKASSKKAIKKLLEQSIILSMSKHGKVKADFSQN